MRGPLYTAALFSGLFASTLAYAEDAKALFLFKDAMQSNTTGLLDTGFNTLLLFRIGVLANGDLVYYSTGGAGEAVDAPVITNGTYVGGDALAEKILSFKTGNSTVERVEVSLLSNDATFQNIRTLVNTNGTGPDTPLYQNFKALKDAWNLDGVDNDDEGVYDVSSTVTFGLMLADMGYKYSAAPYTNINFWLSVTSQLNTAVPNLFDRVYLQCYDGGAGNNPASWQTSLGMKITPIVWVVNDAKPSQSTTVDQALTKFTNWSSTAAVAGGGYWNDYDIEKMGSSYDAYAGVLNTVFG
ncbi:coagulation factor 5/8 type domain-containing protein [Thozetella sp. PMI_491]|nr:coagulation factor 5/8 type domain-containing protein [Thozetella sp. PMI_491]